MLRVRSLIVGGGAAGLAPLVAASRDGRLDALLDQGLAIVERGPTIGAGRLGAYAITSDSTAETFLTAITGHADPRLGRLQADPIADGFVRRSRGAVPLREAGRLLDAIGGILADAVTASGGALLTGHDAQHAQQGCDGAWDVVLRHRDGTPRRVRAEKLLLATGGVQDIGGIEVAGRPLEQSCEGRLMLSDAALRPETLAALRERLMACRTPRVAVVGGSTSALATAGLLLRDCGDLLAVPGSITILHRRPLRVFYPSAAAADRDGYDAFGPDDICPVSGFVYRLAGFRLDSRDLVMRLLGIGDRAPEPRVELCRIDPRDPAVAAQRLADADLVIAATGYKPRALPLRDASGRPIELRGTSGRGSLVDPDCRICDDQGRPIPNLFGIGLAAGFVPQGTFGGEPSFRGQANGLWLWQTAVGSMIVDHLLAKAPSHRAVSSWPGTADPFPPPIRVQGAEPVLSPG